MRLGLIGIGRIGAFHTNTLIGIPAIDSLTVTDIVPEKTKTIVERFGAQGVEGVDSVDALLGVGIDGVIVAAGTDAHTKLILACVEADRFLPTFRAEVETFLEVVRGKRPLPCTVTDGLEADWIAEACAKSQKEHRPVRIEEVRIS